MQRLASSGSTSTIEPPAKKPRVATDLPVVQIEVEEEEKTWLKPDVRKLETDAPISEKEADYKKWLAGVRKGLTRAQQNALNKHMDAVQEQYDAMKTLDRPSLPDLAAKWGLPVTLAAATSEKSLLGLISVASFSTA